MSAENVPQTQYAAVVSEAGGPEKFSWQQVDVPTPGEGEVLIKTAATGLNFIETYQRSGVYTVQYPYIPGTEASGTVIALGAGVSHINIGDRVATAGGRSTYAEYFLAPAGQLIAVPENFDLQEAAAIPLQGMTTHYLCRSTVEVSDGDTVLIHAGAGGVGLLLTQYCKHLGATVYTTAGSEEKKELSRSAGADEAFDYDNFAEGITKRTEEGVDVVFDGVGKTTFDDSLTSIVPRGIMVLFGGSSGQVPDFNLQRLNSSGGLYITRPALGWYTRSADETAWRGQELLDGINEGWLKLRIGQKVALEEAGSAHKAIEARQTTGKTLLTL